MGVLVAILIVLVLLAWAVRAFFRGVGKVVAAEEKRIEIAQTDAHARKVVAAVRDLAHARRTLTDPGPKPDPSNPFIVAGPRTTHEGFDIEDMLYWSRPEGVTHQLDYWTVRLGPDDWWLESTDSSMGPQHWFRARAELQGWLEESWNKFATLFERHPGLTPRTTERDFPLTGGHVWKPRVHAEAARVLHSWEQEQKRQQALEEYTAKLDAITNCQRCGAARNETQRCPSCRALIARSCRNCFFENAAAEEKCQSCLHPLEPEEDEADD